MSRNLLRAHEPERKQIPSLTQNALGVFDQGVPLLCSGSDERPLLIVHPLSLLLPKQAALCESMVRGRRVKSCVYFLGSFLISRTPMLSLCACRTGAIIWWHNKPRGLQMWQSCIVVFHLLPTVPPLIHRPNNPVTYKNIQLWLFSGAKYLLSSLLLIEVVCVCLNVMLGFKAVPLYPGQQKDWHSFYHIVVTSCQLDHNELSWSLFV